MKNNSKNDNFDYQREEKRIIKIDNLGFKIDSYLYDKEDNIINVIEGKPLYFSNEKLFTDNKIQLIWPIIENFIINSQQLNFIADNKPNSFHCLKDLKLEKEMSLFIPNDWISGVIIQNAIDKLTNLKSKTINQIKPSKIKTCTISKIDNNTFSIETEYHNGIYEKEIKSNVKIFLKDLLIPKIYELWGSEEEALSIIKETNISKQQDETLFYEIIGKDGIILKAQIDPYTFDLYGVTSIQRKLKDSNVLTPAEIASEIRSFKK